MLLQGFRAFYFSKSTKSNQVRTTTTTRIKTTTYDNVEFGDFNTTRTHSVRVVVGAVIGFAGRRGAGQRRVSSGVVLGARVGYGVAIASQ